MIEPVEHALKVLAGELPLERLGDLLVVAPEGQQRPLEPLAREYEQLRKFAERLGLTYTPDPDAEAETEQPREAARGATRARRRSGRAAAQPARAAKTRARTRAAKSPGASRGARATSRQRAPRSSKATAARPGSAPARKRAEAATSGKRSAGRRGGAARAGQRHDEVLRLVAEHPGITVRELAERLGIEAAGLYRVVKRLSDDGRVRKDGPSVHPVEPAHAPQDVADSASVTAPAGDGGSPEANAPAEPEAAASTADSASSDDT